MSQLGTLSLAINVLSIGAGAYVMVRLSIIATTALRTHNISPPPSPLQKSYYTRDPAGDVPAFSLDAESDARAPGERRAGTDQRTDAARRLF